VDCNDINSFVSAFNSGSVAANTYTIPEAILNYPAKESGNYMKYMESFLKMLIIMDNTILLQRVIIH
jgi:hypothetical protein